MPDAAPLNMSIDSARALFELIADRANEPRLAHVVGSWELVVDGAGTWTIAVDHGALRVTEGAAPAASPSVPSARIQVGEDELLRLANGLGHQSTVTALMRGAASIEGDLALAYQLRAILPVIEEPWSRTP